MSMTRGFAWAAALVGACGLAAAVTASAPVTTAQQAPDPRVQAGRRLFADACENEHCHGSSAKSVQDFSPLPAEIVKRIISAGLPDAGMQSFKEVYTDEQLDQLVAYVRSMAPAPPPPIAAVQTPAASFSPAGAGGTAPGAGAADEEATWQGDAAAGQALFFDAANAMSCGVCHAFQGRGGRLGPDLGAVGKTKPAREIMRGLVLPGATPGSPPRAAMPADFAARYSLKQLLDLVAFVKSADPTPRPGVRLVDLF